MSVSIIDLYSAVLKHLFCSVCAEWSRRNTFLFSDCLKLLLVSTGSRRLSAVASSKPSGQRTLKDPYPQFQGHAIIWCWLSQKRYEMHTQFQLNTNRDLHTPYWTVSFRMILNDLEWLSEIFNDTKRHAVSLRQLSFLSEWTFGQLDVGQLDRRTTGRRTTACKSCELWSHLWHATTRIAYDQ